MFDRARIKFWRMIGLFLLFIGFFAAFFVQTFRHPQRWDVLHPGEFVIGSFPVERWGIRLVSLGAVIVLTYELFAFVRRRKQPKHPAP